jgi:hypothetical protein
MKKPSFNKVVATFGIAIIFIIVYAALAIIGSLEGAGLTSSLFHAYQSPQQQAPINPPAITSQNANLYGLTPPQAGTSPPPGIPSTSRTQPQNGIYGFENDSTVDPDKISKLVDAGIQRKYLSDPNNYITWGQATLENPNYRDWHDGLKETHLMTDDKIDPLKAAPIMFPSAEDAAIYKNYVTAHANMAKEAPQANLGWGGNVTDFPGIKGIAPYIFPEATNNREALKMQAESVIDSLAGAGVGKTKEPMIDKILNSTDSKTVVPALEKLYEQYPRFKSIVNQVRKQ